MDFSIINLDLLNSTLVLNIRVIKVLSTYVTLLKIISAIKYIKEKTSIALNEIGITKKLYTYFYTLSDIISLKETKLYISYLTIMIITLVYSNYKRKERISTSDK